MANRPLHVHVGRCALTGSDEPVPLDGGTGAAQSNGAPSRFARPRTTTRSSAPVHRGDGVKKPKTAAREEHGHDRNNDTGGRVRRCHHLLHRRPVRFRAPGDMKACPAAISPCPAEARNDPGRFDVRCATRNRRHRSSPDSPRERLTVRACGETSSVPDSELVPRFCTMPVAGSTESATVCPSPVNVPLTPRNFPVPPVKVSVLPGASG